MQSINEFTIHAAVAIQSWVADAMERMHSDEEGQTAVEYAGILALLGVIFAAIFALGLDAKISSAIKGAVDGILKGK